MTLLPPLNNFTFQSDIYQSYLIYYPAACFDRTVLMEMCTEHEYNQFRL